MLRKLVLATLTSVALAGLVGGNRALAGDGCCASCGRQCDVSKVCRRVEDKKTITVTCWGFDEEDFCVPGPSNPGCEHSEDVCESDGCCLHGCTRSLVWTDWLPSDRAKVFTRKKLRKKTVTKTVPTWKWVVEDRCAACQH